MFNIIRLSHTNVLHAVYKKPYIFYFKSRENPYQVLQVTCAASERAMKLKVRMIKSLSP